MDISEICSLAKIGERRNYEFKRSMNWQDSRFKLIKSIMAMSNIQDGGSIILGLEEDRNNNTFYTVGISPEDQQSFNYDIVADQVNEYSDPYVNFFFETVRGHDKVFLIIKVLQFDEVPAVCKKNYQEGKYYELEDGAIYTRTKGGRPKTSRVMSSVDLRDIIDLAIRKGIKSHLQDLGLIAPSLATFSKSDAQQFDDQAEELE